MNFPNREIGTSRLRMAAPPMSGSPARPPFFAFRKLPSRKQISITIEGFWDAGTFARFAVELQKAIASLGCAPGEHLLCCDVSNAAIQPQEIVKAFQHLILHGPTHSRRLALWTSNPLSRMQARRIVGIRDNIAVFACEADANRWLAG